MTLKQVHGFTPINETTPSRSRLEAVVIGPSSASQVSSSQKSQSSSKVRGTKRTQSQTTINLEENNSQLWKCHWRGCSSELHDFPTLEKHVTKVHKSQSRNGEFECKWDKCGKTYPDGSKEYERFDSDEWDEHVESHLAFYNTGYATKTSGSLHLIPSHL